MASDHLPPGWTESPLEDCMAAIIDYRGKTPVKSPSGVPLVTAKVVKQGRLLALDEFIPHDSYDAWMRRGLPQPGDVVFTTEAPLGEVARLDDRKVALAQRIITLRGKPGLLDTRFLLYLLQSAEVGARIGARASGTTVLGIKQRELRKVRLPLPPIAEQRAIAHILGTLDDKIELNRRQNETLEAMARALFKSWFVDFDPVRAKAEGREPVGMDDVTAALFPSRLVESELGLVPEGWPVVTLADEFRLTMGQSPPGSTYNESGEGLPFYQGTRDFGARFPALRVFCTGPTRLAHEGDTLVSVRAPVGDLNVATEECCIGRGVAAVRHSTGSVAYTLFAMMALKPYFERFESEGTVFGCINKIDFMQLPMVRPTAAVIARYREVAEPLLAQVLANHQQGQQLAAVRDTLLPRLLSGDLRVTVGDSGAGCEA